MTAILDRAQSARSIPSDRSFFLAMAAAVTLTVVVGFGIDINRPQVQFASAPPHVHLHAAVFTLWIFFYLLQNALVARGAIGLHRALGVFGALLAGVMVVLGMVTTVLALRLDRVPPFFPPGVFLLLDGVAMVAFAGLVTAAIALRRDAAWHKRLMLCATIIIMGPALGRLLPMPLLGPWSTWAVHGVMLLYVAAAAFYDKVARGRVHPAYGWGTGAMVVTQLLVATLSFSPPVLAFVDWLKS